MKEEKKEKRRRTYVMVEENSPDTSVTCKTCRRKMLSDSTAAMSSATQKASLGLEHSPPRRGPTKRRRTLTGTFLHFLKWLGFWFVCSKAFLLWMAYNDAETYLPVVHHPNVSYAHLNKYGNDTSGCPTLPNHVIRVRKIR